MAARKIGVYAKELLGRFEVARAFAPRHIAIIEAGKTKAGIVRSMNHFVKKHGIAGSLPDVSSVDVDLDTTRAAMVEYLKGL